MERPLMLQLLLSTLPSPLLLLPLFGGQAVTDGGVESIRLRLISKVQANHLVLSLKLVEEGHGGYVGKLVVQLLLKHSLPHGQVKNLNEIGPPHIILGEGSHPTVPAPPGIVVRAIGAKHLHHCRTQTLTPVVEQPEDLFILLPAD